MKQASAMFIFLIGMLVSVNHASANFVEKFEISGIVDEITSGSITVRDKTKFIKLKLTSQSSLPKRELKKGDMVKIHYSYTVDKIEIQMPGIAAPAVPSLTGGTHENDPNGVIDDRAFYRA